MLIMDFNLLLQRATESEWISHFFTTENTSPYSLTLSSLKQKGPKVEPVFLCMNAEIPLDQSNWYDASFKWCRMYCMHLIVVG